MPRFASMCVLCFSFFDAGWALAAVDLVLRREPQTVTVGAQFEIGLFAVWDHGTEQKFSGVEVILTWNPTLLAVDEVVANGPHTWVFVFGFLWDEGLDGLNADCGEDVFCDPYTGVLFNDGDVLFQAGSFAEATATADGLRVATFLFTALGGTPGTDVVIEESLGVFSTTRVLRPGNIDVTGNLESTTVTIEGVAIPTLSEWGMAVMTIMLLTIGVAVIAARRTSV